MGMKRKQMSAALVVLALLLALLPAPASQAGPGASLSLEILSFDKIGLDKDGPGTPENPTGPDQSIVHARVENNGTVAVSNVYLAFEWVSSSNYVQMHGSETHLKSVGTLEPGQSADVMWVLKASRNMAAIGATCMLEITATSQEVPNFSVRQTLTVVGMEARPGNFTVQAYSAVNVGDIFEVQAEHFDTRAMAEIFVPLQFNRSLFELVSVRVDYYIDNSFTSDPYSETDMHYSGPTGQSGKIPYEALRAYYTLRAVSPGEDTLALLHMDVSVSAGASFNYSPNLWSAEKSHTITVNGQDAPVAVNDSYEMKKGGSLSVSAPGLLANDWYPAGSDITINQVSGPSHGTLHLSNDGSFSYEPVKEFSGLDTFVYNFQAGGLTSNNATVSILVKDVVSITGRVLGEYVMGVKLTLKDFTSQTVTTVTVDNPDGTYSLEASPGTYSLVIDATVVDVEMTIRDVNALSDIQEAYLTIDKYDDCPHPAPSKKLFVKAVDLDIAESLRDGTTVVLHYTHGDIGTAGVWDRSLQVYHWTDSQWKLMPSVLNLQANTITFHPESFSPFAIFGEPPRSVSAYPSLGLGVAGGLLVGLVAFFIRRRPSSADRP